MRVCVAGGGLAGAALAWRLAQLAGITVDLVTGRHRARDATSASGGAVRAYETLAAQRELAIASMAELLASQVLRRWAGFRQASFAYVRDDAADLTDQVGEIERALPGSATVLSAAEAFGSTADGQCWAGGDGAAVVERQAGSVSPGGLRDALIADLVDRPRTRVKLAGLTEATVRAEGGVRWRAEDIDGEHDVLVLAAGAWTPRPAAPHRLPGSGLPDQVHSVQQLRRRPVAASCLHRRANRALRQAAAGRWHHPRRAGQGVGCGRWLRGHYARRARAGGPAGRRMLPAAAPRGCASPDECCRLLLRPADPVAAFGTRRGQVAADLHRRLWQFGQDGTGRQPARGSGNSWLVTSGWLSYAWVGPVDVSAPPASGDATGRGLRIPVAMRASATISAIAISGHTR